MTFVDTNVIIDVLARDPVWFQWSMNRLYLAIDSGNVMTSAVVTAELSRDYAVCSDLLTTLQTLSIESLPLDVEAAFLAGKAFARYRFLRGADEPARILPDFFIGAHALIVGGPLVTRDARLFRRYFPDLALITPETHP